MVGGFLQSLISSLAPATPSTRVDSLAASSHSFEQDVKTPIAFLVYSFPLLDLELDCITSPSLHPLRSSDALLSLAAVSIRIP